MRRAASWLLIAAICPLSPAPRAHAQDAAVQLRAQLAAAYLRFDRLYAQHPPGEAQRPAFNRDIDALTRFFFSGDATRAVEELAILTARLLHTAGPGDLPRLTAAITARPEPPVLDRCLGRPGLVRLAAPGGAPFALAQPARGALLLRAADHHDALRIPVQINPGDDDTAVAVDPTRLPAISQTYDLYLELADLPPVLVGNLAVHCGSMSDLRDRNTQRLADIPFDPALEQAMATSRARNALLTDNPSPSNSTSVAVDIAAIADRLPAEIDALQRGDNPYRMRTGDTWRVLRLGASDIPMRIYAPQAAALHKPLPLVIALHGAGGDENLFPCGYGGGLIRRLADEHNFIAVSPRTEFFLANPGAFHALIELMSADYAIDPDRVYALGHSLGAIASSTSAPDLTGTLAAIACLAGPVFTPPGRSGPPALLIAAEFDPVAPPARLSRLAEQARDAGMRVEFRAMPGLGHTLMVNDALPDAIAWLLEQRLQRPR